jgi:sigma-B regulation protein RsbU (phosphoserine phosphatase)
MTGRVERFSGVDVEVVSRPLDMVGGDIHDVRPLPDGRIRLLLADATGHGVRASLVTMPIRSEYESIRETAAGPAEALRALNDRIAVRLGHLVVHFTAICLDLDPRAGLVTYAAGAAPGPCLVRAAQPRELDSGGPFVGLRADAPFPAWRVELQPGDVFCLFTDGLFEQWAGDGQQFGTDRLMRAVADAARLGLPLGAGACSALDLFMAGRPLTDDLTFLGLRWMGPAARGDAEANAA